MTPLLHPFPVNEPFGGLAVYVALKYARHGLLFRLAGYAWNLTVGREVECARELADGVVLDDSQLSGD